MALKLLNQNIRGEMMSHSINNINGEQICQQIIQYETMQNRASRKADNWLKWSLIAIVALLASSSLSTISPYLSTACLIGGILSTPVFLSATGINLFYASHYARKIQILKKELRQTLTPAPPPRAPFGFPFGITTR